MRKLEAGWEVSSAGTWTTDGLPAAPSAITSARRLGLDIASHSSRALNAQLMIRADLIIVMEQGHKEALCLEFPEHCFKVHLLSEITIGKTYDIQDPAGSVSVGEIPEEIDELIHAGFQRICVLARQR